METSLSKGQRAPDTGHPGQLLGSGLVDVDGHQLYWERYGNDKNPIVLLLHHGLGSIRSWRRQIPAFVESGWQVLVYDRWGYGRSDERPSFQQAYLASDTGEAFHLLEALELDELALVGHSDGGSIALLMAADQPARFSALVVVAAHIYFESRMTEGLAQINQSTLNPVWIQSLKREHGERAQRLALAWVEHWRLADPQSLNMLDRLSTVSCPTLVVQGMLDEHATPQHAMDIQQAVQDGQLWLIPNVKHMPPHEIPEIFNRRVLEFLSGSSA